MQPQRVELAGPRDSLEVGAVAEHVELLATGVHDGDALARRRCIETRQKLCMPVGLCKLCVL